MKKRSLTNLKQRVILDDKEFILSSLTLGAKERIDVAFDKEGLTYESGMEKVLAGDVKIGLLFVYCLISEESNPFKDFEEFCKVAKKNLKPIEMNTIIENVFTDSLPNFTLEEKKSPLIQRLMGWLIILAAGVGLTHMFIWLLGYIFHIQIL